MSFPFREAFPKTWMKRRYEACWRRLVKVRNKWGWWNGRVNRISIFFLKHTCVIVLAIFVYIYIYSLYVQYVYVINIYIYIYWYVQYVYIIYIYIRCWGSQTLFAEYFQVPLYSALGSLDPTSRFSWPNWSEGANFTRYPVSNLDVPGRKLGNG